MAQGRALRTPMRASGRLLKHYLEIRFKTSDFRKFVREDIFYPQFIYIIILKFKGIAQLSIDIKSKELKAQISKQEEVKLELFMGTTLSFRS